MSFVSHESDYTWCTKLYGLKKECTRKGNDLPRAPKSSETGATPVPGQPKKLELMSAASCFLTKWLVLCGAVDNEYITHHLITTRMVCLQSCEVNALMLPIRAYPPFPHANTNGSQNILD